MNLARTMPSVLIEGGPHFRGTCSFALHTMHNVKGFTTEWLFTLFPIIQLRTYCLPFPPPRLPTGFLIVQCKDLFI